MRAIIALFLVLGAVPALAQTSPVKPSHHHADAALRGPPTGPPLPLLIKPVGCGFDPDANPVPPLPPGCPPRTK